MKITSCNEDGKLGQDDNKGVGIILSISGCQLMSFDVYLLYKKLCVFYLSLNYLYIFGLGVVALNILCMGKVLLVFRLNNLQYKLNFFTYSHCWFRCFCCFCCCHCHLRKTTLLSKCKHTTLQRV